MDATALAHRLLDPVPVHRSCGLQVLRSDETGSEVALEVTEGLSNVVGAMHASGLTTLVDAAGLTAIIGAAEDDRELDGVLPLGAVATLRFRAPAYGRLVATGSLDDEARAAARSVLGGHTDHARLQTTAEVRDGEGHLVCEGTFGWSVRRHRAPD